jgi:hypothetical protein
MLHASVSLPKSSKPQDHRRMSGLLLVQVQFSSRHVASMLPYGELVIKLQIYEELAAVIPHVFSSSAALYVCSTKAIQKHQPSAHRYCEKQTAPHTLDAIQNSTYNIHVQYEEGIFAYSYLPVHIGSSLSLWSPAFCRTLDIKILTYSHSEKSVYRRWKIDMRNIMATASFQSFFFLRDSMSVCPRCLTNSSISQHTRAPSPHAPLTTSSPNIYQPIHHPFNNPVHLKYVLAATPEFKHLAQLS